MAVDAAEEALRVAKGLYQFGNGLFLDVLVAQDQLLSARIVAGQRDIQPRILLS